MAGLDWLNLSLQVGKNVDKWLWMLSAMRIMTRAEGDCNVVKSKHGSIQADFKAWKVKLLNRLQKLAKGDKKSCSGNCKTGGSCKNNTKNGHEQEEDERATQLNNSSEVTLLTLKTKKGFIQFRYDRSPAHNFILIAGYLKSLSAFFHPHHGYVGEPYLICRRKYRHAFVLVKQKAARNPPPKKTSGIIRQMHCAVQLLVRS